MIGRKVLRGDCADGVLLRMCRDGGVHIVCDGLKRKVAGLSDELISRPEVLVEAAMGKPGGGHEIGERGAANAVLSKFRRRCCDDVLPCLCGFQLRSAHRSALLGRQSPHGDRQLDFKRNPIPITDPLPACPFVGFLGCHPGKQAAPMARKSWSGNRRPI